MSKNKLKKPNWFRVYVGWQDGFVSDETKTETQAVAQHAFDKLMRGLGRFCNYKDAKYITMTFEHKNIHYYEIKNND